VASSGGNAQRRRNDAELLAAHAAGDRYAFEELFYRHYRQLHRLARLTSRNPEDAADALQDAMLAAHRSAGSFRNDAAVSSWLYRIVVNACLDRIRRNKAYPTTVLDVDHYFVADRTAHVETAIVVQRALMGLPVGQRAAVVAVDMQGYSIADTARLLGVPEGTVKSRCARARARLAAALGYLDSGVPTGRDRRTS
jgi:RNA polymerase sigma-70 factor (ECF subfamily)